ncbi:MAG: hypothetical protein B7Z73_01845 [Planctomycetia bacterium 21-64-5]|nr:MAG: hypothetical protein B7Z73_01845 [Planctomycetia bacterium 21-64-5]HQU43538.1 hypothetical protein [Pirellulales bacterium]
MEYIKAGHRRAVVVDYRRAEAENSCMSIDTPTKADATSELQQAIERMMAGVRDPEVGRQARDDMDRMREETQKRVGTVEVAVDLIRDARDP